MRTNALTLTGQEIVLDEAIVESFRIGLCGELLTADDRLVSIKTKYDPDNLFRINNNISPSVEPVGIGASRHGGHR